MNTTTTNTTEKTIVFPMTFNTVETYLPSKRHRKERKHTVAVTRSFSLNVLKEDYFPLAARVTKYPGTPKEQVEEIRYHDGSFYKIMVRTERTAERTWEEIKETPESCHNWKADIMTRSGAYDYHRWDAPHVGDVEDTAQGWNAEAIITGSDEEKIVASATAAFKKYKVFNGYLWEPTGEPFYHYDAWSNEVEVRFVKPTQTKYDMDTYNALEIKMMGTRIENAIRYKKDKKTEILGEISVVRPEFFRYGKDLTECRNAITDYMLEQVFHTYERDSKNTEAAKKTPVYQYLEKNLANRIFEKCHERRIPEYFITEDRKSTEIKVSITETILELLGEAITKAA